MRPFLWRSGAGNLKFYFNNDLFFWPLFPRSFYTLAQEARSPFQSIIYKQNNLQVLFFPKMVLLLHFVHVTEPSWIPESVMLLFTQMPLGIRITFEVTDIFNIPDDELTQHNNFRPTANPKEFRMWQPAKMPGWNTSRRMI